LCGIFIESQIDLIYCELTDFLSQILAESTDYAVKIVSLAVCWKLSVQISQNQRSLFESQILAESADYAGKKMEYSPVCWKLSVLICANQPKSVIPF
jgi:hypothetical protein